MRPLEAQDHRAAAASAGVASRVWSHADPHLHARNMSDTDATSSTRPTRSLRAISDAGAKRLLIVYDE